jgi:TRAP-type C4-dicarboxylate transport system permease small subunit
VTKEDRLYHSLEWVAAADLFSLMLVVAADVAGRYLFNNPLPAGYEMVQVLMGVLAFSSLPLISRSNEHIALGLIDHLFTGRADRVRMFFVNAFSGAVLGFMTWRLWVNAGELQANRDATAVLQIPLAPICYFMAAMSALAVASLLLLAVRALRRGGQ